MARLLEGKWSKSLLMLLDERFHPVALVGLNKRAISILAHYSNRMFLVEYDDFGRPLNIAPNGKQGIFCMSPDGFWNGWFVLDEDVRFSEENKILNDIID
jgi:hypothetical protein